MVADVVDLKDFDRYTAKLNGELNGMTFIKPLKICRQLLVSDIKENFAGGHDPEGNPWAALKRPRTLPRSRRKAVKAKRRRTGQADKPLRDTGLLMASYTATGPGHIEIMTGTELVYGTNVWYASFHHTGTRNMPARVAIGVSDKLADRFSEVFGDYVQQKIGGR